jgi:hypothetical protein
VKKEEKGGGYYRRRARNRTQNSPNMIQISTSAAPRKGELTRTPTFSEISRKILDNSFFDGLNKRKLNRRYPGPGNPVISAMVG